MLGLLFKFREYLNLLMVLDKLIFKSYGLSKLWLILAIVQASLFTISAIVASAMGATSNYWLWEYLTLTRGFPNSSDASNPMAFPIVWLCINLVITSFDFWLSYSVHGEIIKALRNRTSSFKEQNILNKMRRYLTFILVCLLVALFMQVLHGVLWWIVGGAVLAVKYLYFKELEYLKKIV